MKKLVQISVIALAIAAILVPATPAAAATLRVKTKAYVRVTNGVTRVVFRSKLSRRGRVRIVITKSGKRIRTLTSKVTRSKQSVVWNLRDSKGHKVRPGLYRFRTIAIAKAHTVSVAGKVRIRKPPVPSTPTTTTPSVPSTTTPSVPSTTTPSTGTTASAGGETTTTPSVPVTPTVPVANSSRWFGAYVPGLAGGNEPLDQFESQVGATAKVVNFFISDSESFPTPRVDRITANGSTPMVTLELWSIGDTGLDAIINGSKDAYLTDFAQDAKADGNEVWVRPMHEMNGNWYPWCGTVGVNTAAKYIAAWRHIHDVFEAQGAANIKLVWCANNDSAPATTANDMTKYFPGEAYVDYMAIDGYNWGTTKTWSSWRSFYQTFATSYAKVAALSSKPMFVAETACAEQGGSKALWVADMFSQMKTKFPRLQGVCWFNHTDNSWNVDSSSASLQAFRTGLASAF